VKGANHHSKGGSGREKRETWGLLLRCKSFPARREPLGQKKKKLLPPITTPSETEGDGRTGFLHVLGEGHQRRGEIQREVAGISNICTCGKTCLFSLWGNELLNILSQAVFLNKHADRADREGSNFPKPGGRKPQKGA